MLNVKNIQKSQNGKLRSDFITGSFDRQHRTFSQTQVMAVKRGVVMNSPSLW